MTSLTRREAGEVPAAVARLLAHGSSDHAAHYTADLQALARTRGRDPDRPPHLAKVTRTR